MKGLMKVALGVLAGIGGFLEVGSLATSAQAGASFRFELLWALAFGTICVIFLSEMAGRLASVSKHALADAVRERFGFRFSILPRLAECLVNLLVLSAEIGGVSFALHLATGIRLQWWAPVVALALWLVIWTGTLSTIENFTSVLGLLTVAFVVAAFRLHPPLKEIAAGFLPSFPHSDLAHYAFIAVSIIGSTISPYIFYFYSAGAVEEKWNESDLRANQVSSIAGMGFGSLVTVGVVATATMVFVPRGIQIDSYEQMAIIFTPVFGAWGFPIFVAALAICCFGAAVELSLANSYMIAQTLGWNSSENASASQEARFSLSYTIFIAAAGLVMMTGIDPLKITILSMAITAVVLPVVVLPFLLLMNDETYVGEHRNGWIGNTVVVVVIFVSALIALVAIPLELLGGS